VEYRPVFKSENSVHLNGRMLSEWRRAFKLCVAGRKESNGLTQSLLFQIEPAYGA
jgi:hypothetical protein